MTKHPATPNDRTERRPYEPPVLTCHGDLRRVTMGISPGVGDSLDPLTRKSGGFAPPGPPNK